MSVKKTSFSEDIFDGLCGITCTIIGIIGIFISALQTGIGNIYFYMGGLIFWICWFIFSLFFTIKIFISRKKLRKAGFEAYSE